MINHTQYAAIDIGSNAIRLLIATVGVSGNRIHIKKESLTRIPVRLGIDVFNQGKISPEREARLVHALQAYYHLIKAHEIKHFRACATAALRESQNGSQIIKNLERKAHIEIDLISGSEEAELLSSVLSTYYPISRKNYLFVDLGGGSTELSFCQKGKITKSKSFKIGTLRVLNGHVTEQQWDEMTQWTKEHSKGLKNLTLVGTGGNINKLHKMYGHKPTKPVPLSFLNSMQTELSSLSFEERMEKYSLNSSRADVIVPALKVFTTIMESLNEKEILVPRVGLVDAIVRDLFLKSLKSTY